MKYASYADVQAEVHIIAAMMDARLQELTDDVDLNLFQSYESKTIASKILINRYKNGVTPKIILNELREDGNLLDYMNVVLRATVSKSEVDHFMNRLKVARSRSIYANHGYELLQLANRDDAEHEELERLAHNPPFVHDDAKSPLYVKPEEYAGEMFKNLHERVMNPEKEQGIRLRNFPQLDKTFLGFRGGDLIMISAQSGHGKTAIALNLAKDIAVDQKNTLYYLNAEMNVEELSTRIVSNMSNVSATEIMDGRFEVQPNTTSGEILHNISVEVDKLGKTNLFLSRIPVMTIGSIRKGYRQLSQVGKKPDLLIIDYIGRMEIDGPTSGKSEWQQLYELSEDIKTMAVDLDIPIIVLSQLNGDGKIEGAKKMKNACDGVLFFEPLGDDTEEESKYMTNNQRKYANCKIVKYKVRRNDNSKPIYVQFNRDKQRVLEIE